LSDTDAHQTFFIAEPRIGQSGTASYTGLALDVTEDSVGSGVNKLLDLSVGTVSKFFVQSNGNTFINDTANTKITQGLTINQGASDDEILDLKSSDVAHSVTDNFEADTYAAFSKTAAATGGLSVTGITDADAEGALLLRGIISAADPTDTNAAVVLTGAKLATNTYGKLGDAETVAKIKNYTTDIVTILGNGDTKIGDATVAQTVLGSGKVTVKGTTGGFTRLFSEATANITADASITIQVNIPATSRIIGCQLRVDAALATGELWDAAYSGGSTDAIATGQAVAQNTKVNSLTTATVTSETDIAITKNGGGSFTAQGTIRAIVYYETFETMASL
jgi:hypothetical protein